MFLTTPKSISPDILDIFFRKNEPFLANQLASYSFSLLWKMKKTFLGVGKSIIFSVKNFLGNMNFPVNWKMERSYFLKVRKVHLFYPNFSGKMNFPVNWKMESWFFTQCQLLQLHKLVKNNIIVITHTFRQLCNTNGSDCNVLCHIHLATDEQLQLTQTNQEILFPTPETSVSLVCGLVAYGNNST